MKKNYLEKKKMMDQFLMALLKKPQGFSLIDEVTEIPLETQSKILRVVIDQKFKRINGNHDKCRCKNCLFYQ